MAGQGALQMRVISRRCREMGSEGKGLQRELQAGLQRGARPAIGAIRWEALLTLPSSGGKQVRKLKIVNRVTVDGNEFKVRRRAGKLQANEPLAQRVAGASFTVRIIGGGRNPAVQIRGRAKSGKSLDIRSIDEGLVRHPVFGDRDYWKDQKVPPGFFTRACRANLDEVRKGLKEAIESAAAQLNQAT